ncbi:hypothetical protein Ahy_A01g002355 [Arachis hypogaea]|uniref:Uncharacterized protein n=1 Tax=Arachis hypogaea TaxID=3818 RepID=A0A445EQJ5_ARAHY|nr:hypothetical protein Ahy_A01g002355 [Arachis hypogaea]
MWILRCSHIYYDHQVLLDYLISKDTGISYAKYLVSIMSALPTTQEKIIPDATNYKGASAKRSKTDGFCLRHDSRRRSDGEDDDTGYFGEFGDVLDRYRAIAIFATV